VSGARARAESRGARAALSVAVALAALAVVVTVSGRGQMASRASEPGEGARAGGVLAATVVGGGQVGVPRGAVSPPSAVTRGRRDEPDVSAGLERWDSPGFDSNVRPERLALARARQGLPIDGVVPHQHLATGEAAAPEARAPAVELGAVRSGASGAQGWDGGDFWFGPNGLIRMREAQR
jgi:hypothetical protein